MAAWSEHEDGPWVETRSALGQEMGLTEEGKFPNGDGCQKHEEVSTPKSFNEGLWIGMSEGCEESRQAMGVSTPLPTPCPRCNHATIGDCLCSEPFPTEVWTFFDDEALGQLVIDVMAEIGRRKMAA